jgi:hypothetical protein
MGEKPLSRWHRKAILPWWNIAQQLSSPKGAHGFANYAHGFANYYLEALCRTLSDIKRFASRLALSSEISEAESLRGIAGYIPGYLKGAWLAR